jgi:hypothetical protein
MTTDPLEALLRAAPLNDRQRAGLWDMYEASKNADDLAARLQSMELPNDLKAQMWDLKAQSAAPQEPPPSGGASGSWKEPTWSDKLGLNEPTDSMVKGFGRGASAAAVDMLQGATSAFQNKIAKGGDTALRQVLGAVPVEQQQDVAQAPDTFAAKVGSLAPVAAEMALPGPGVVRGGKAVAGAIPSAARAGDKFQDVMGAARNVTVDVQEVGDVALRINQLAERGGSMPMAVRKILNRMTDPNKADMVYEESRDFASNIGRLSRSDYQRMSPTVAREVAKLSAALNQANAKAAQAAGKGAEYKAAMREYARAMRIQEAISATLSGAKKAVPWMGAAGAATWMTGKIANAIQGQ